MSKRRADRLYRLRREKRGVVLLVVVSLLTLFLMIGVTYVLIAGNYQNASAQNQRAHRYGDEPEREAEEILGQILYGSLPSNPRSVIAPHSLLEDLYGNDGVSGFVMPVANNPVVTNSGQVIRVQVNITSLATPHPIPNYYAGRVITFTSGSAAGISTRIMGYVPPAISVSGNPEIMVEAPESDLPITVSLNANDRFVINGAPFNGTGAGFEAGSNNLESAFTLSDPTPYYTSYLPNRAFLPPGFNPAVGGMDETWDVPDYQNMLMALIPPLKTSQFDSFPLLPSLHRPDLVRYWRNLWYGTLLSGVAPADQRNAFLFPYGYDGSLGTGDDWPGLTPQQAQELVNVKRMFILRPLREDHPNFTGGNQNFVPDSLNGPYDVDNDGDGISDSIWVDAGLPVVTAPNGRRYKRLVAILIKDLDGRVNPSVHGNLALTFNPNFRTAAQVTDTFAGMDPNSPTPINLPRGLGFGPAEVDFRHIFNNVLPYSSGNDNAGMYDNILRSRYLPNVSGQAAFPGFSDGVPGNVNNDDGWSRLKTIGMPTDHLNPPLSAYSTPPDVWGRAALAVDYTGQPIWGFAGDAERIDDPYEMQWDQLRASVDAPYTVSELEGLLRYHDLGASVPNSRLINLSGGFGGYLASEPRGTPGDSQIRREAFGVGSYIPAPKLVMPRELRSSYGGGISATILDLYYARLNQDNAQFQTVVPFEFLKGQMFNLNRELGNGQQDQTAGDQAASGATTAPFGTVDDPTEATLPEQIPTTAGQVNFNYLNDSVAFDQRQLYARHLYCLMMLLKNSSYQYPIDLNGDGAVNQQDTARYFAQWAINVVDFRDADSIMSGFEYDNDPFDGGGWQVDGNLQTNESQGGVGGVVWGCERPELLLTETIAGHDRRTNDSNRDPSMRRVDDPVAANRDEDYDQELRPEGWAFIELYNPWYDRSNNQYDHKALELYGNGGVQLDRLTPANGPRYPVWRILVVRGGSFNTNPDNIRPEQLTATYNGNPPPMTNGRPDVERSIYFADLSAAGVNRPSAAGYIDGEAFFPSGTIPRTPLGPGRYAVIGSSGKYDAAAGTYTTYIGRRMDAPSADTIPDFYDPTQLNLGTTRRIVLNPTAGTLTVADNQNNGAADGPPAMDIMPVVALPLDMAIRSGAPTPQSFNVTEPTEAEGLYPALAAFPPSPTDEGHYSPALDSPLDASRTGGEWQFLTNDQTITNHRAIHLQRLANPLLPWDSVTNPYLTIDSSNMDATAYNGVTIDSDDPQKLGGTNLNLQTFQRGGRFAPTDVGGYPDPNRVYRELWKREPVTPGPTTSSPPETATGPHHLPRSLWHTLGYLNKRYHPYFGAAAGGYRGSPYYQDTTPAIAAPFPWLTFNNRPFNNRLELLLVPSCSSSKLLENFSVQDINPLPTTWVTMYDPANNNVPYGHLPNFFQTSNNPNANSTAPEIVRILDYVETRSPFIDTEKYYNPAAFFNDPVTPSGYRPPFNYLSRFREPGRININTIFDDNVWNAAVRGFPGMCSFPQNTNEGDGGLFLSHLVLSRQGYGTQPADILQHDPAYPSLFSNPFRTADAGDMMPPVPAQLRVSPANAGLLRRDANQYPPPLIDVDRPLFASDNTLPYQDASRNPYFRFQGLQKVGNLFSTNSNCYAVWMTIGYFEVESNGGVDGAHPDGLRLAQEVGVDEGNVKRHRAFYIIDRSVPVAFEPGHRHNTDKAVLLKRFIE